MAYTSNYTGTEIDTAVGKLAYGTNFTISKTSAYIQVDGTSTSDAGIRFATNGTTQWTIGKQSSNRFVINNSSSTTVMYWESGSSIANMNFMPKIIQHDGDYIISEGSNSNGYFTKFSGGTMICRTPSDFAFNQANTEGTSVYYGTDETWIFPATFYATPVVTANPAGSGRTWATVSTVGTTECGIVTLCDFQQTSNLGGGAIAIGRWK